MNTDIYAAIDIGSNAIRLLINNVEKYPFGQDFNKTAFLRVPIRLGEDVFTKGKIGEHKEQQLINTMQAFSYLIKAYNVKYFRACATSAMRDAENGKEIAEFIFAKTGINIEIITGKQEAEIIFEAGAFDNLLNKNKNYLYVDVGGGSTEVVVYSKNRKVESNSFQLGTVRMLVDAVKDEEFNDFNLWLNNIYKQHAPLRIIASGGNINKIHKLLGKRENEHISYSEMNALYNTLQGMTYNERIIEFKLNEYRADVILPALKIFTTIAKTCKIKEIYVPKIGLADGIIRQLYMLNNENNNQY